MGAGAERTEAEEGEQRETDEASGSQPLPKGISVASGIREPCEWR